MATMMGAEAPHRPGEQGQNSDERGVTQSMNARYLTIDEVAAYLNMKVKTLYAIVSDIPHYKVGRLLRFTKEDVDQWMEQRRTCGDQQRGKGRRSPAKDHTADALVRKAIDEVKGARYTPYCGKQTGSRASERR